MSSNPFDQFDSAPNAQATPTAQGANTFDQFDTPKEPSSASSDYSASDFLKDAAQHIGRLSMLGVKGFNDSVIHLLSLPADITTYVGNKVSGDNAPSLGSQWQQYSDKTIAPPSNFVEQGADLAGGFAAGAKLPLPGNAPGPTGQLADSLAAARGSGYVIPKSAITNKVGVGEQLMGHKEILTDATQRNLKEMSANLAEQFGLPKGTEITHDTMDAVRNEAGKAYEAIASISPEYSATIEKIKSLRSDAQGYYRQISNNYDHDVAKKADDLWNQAQTLEGQMANNLQPGVTPGLDPNLYSKFLDARRTIAQAHDVDKALINSRGETNAATFSKMYGKEKPLTGELGVAGRAAQAFKSAFTTGGGRALPFTDAALMGGGATLGYIGSHDPKLILAAALAGGARFGARKLALSGPVQDYALLSQDQKINALAQALMAAGVANQGSQGAD